MKALLKKEHKITAGSQGQTCFSWSKNVRHLAQLGVCVTLAAKTEKPASSAGSLV
jgi:hypothetical protein